MRFEGLIRSWDDERGFGFIEPTLGGQDIFVHIKAFPRGAARPAIGQRVSFEVELGPQGKKRARKAEAVRPAGGHIKARRSSPAQWGTATLFAIPAFLVVYVATGILWRHPPWVGLVYLIVTANLFIGAIQGLVMQSLLAGDVERIRREAPSVFSIYRRGISATP